MAGILISKKDIASMSIKDKIIQKSQLKSTASVIFYDVDNVLLLDESYEKHIKNEDFLIVASRHKSESKRPCLTAHFPGNISDTVKLEMGGKPRTLGIGYGSLLSAYIKYLDVICKLERIDVEVVLEQDHHGPTINKPLMFVEIGSSENEWKNDKYAEIVAEAILNVIAGFKKYNTSFIAIGNTHYPMKFTNMVLNEDYCFSHIFSKYYEPYLDEFILKHAIHKSVEKVKGLVIDWKSLRAVYRSKIMAIAEKYDLEIIRV